MDIESLTVWNLYLFQKWLVGYILCLNWGGVYFEIWKHMSQWITVFQPHFCWLPQAASFRGCYTVWWTRAPCPTSSGRYLVNIAASYVTWVWSFLGPSTVPSWTSQLPTFLHSATNTAQMEFSCFFHLPKSLKSSAGIWFENLPGKTHHRNSCSSKTPEFLELKKKIWQRISPKTKTTNKRNFPKEKLPISLGEFLQ